MNFQRKQREEVSVNLTPLIDIVFLLLIFFMVSTTFTKENHLSINLPEASAEAADQPEQMIEILITASGEYSVNDKTLINSQLETLKRAIWDVKGNADNLPVVITADAKAAHESVVRAMDAVGQVGLVKLSFTTRPSTRSSNNE